MIEELFSILIISNARINKRVDKTSFFSKNNEILVVGYPL